MQQDEALEALRKVSTERATLAERTGRAIDDARGTGLTWLAIGEALGMTHSGAIQAHQRWKEQR